MAKKVLLIVNEYPAIIHYRMELVRTLVEEGHIVAVALPPHKRVREIEELGCKFFPLSVDQRGTNPVKDLKMLRDISRILKDFKPDIVFTFTIKPNVYGGITCAWHKIPFIATITGVGSAIENGGVLRNISLSLYKLGLRKAHMVVFHNQGNRDLFQKAHIFKGNTFISSGSGVNLERFQLMPYPKDNCVDFAFVGRIMKEKGIEEFLSAAKYIKNKYPNTRFHICGRCIENYQEKLREFEEKGVIQYHGMIKDMVPIYAKMHCIVHPSYYEGMANVLLESASCGRPIIATDIFGCREAVEEGKTGLLVESRNVDSLKYALEKFINLPYEVRKAMGIAGRKKMETEFDRKKVVNMYLNAILK